MKKMFFWVLLAGSFAFSQLYLADQIEAERKKQGIEFRIDSTKLDPIELIGTKILSNFRGLVVDYLWVRSRSSEVQENIEELPILYDLITSLQPNFVESSSFAASSLGMDISTRFDTAEEQWFWILEGLKLFEKSIRRNLNHPRVWKLYQTRAYYISQKCLPTSQYFLFGAECAQFFEEEFGRDPHEVMIADYRRLLDYTEDVPGGWLFGYAQGYETWALATSDPEEQLGRVREAQKAWQETLTRSPILQDDERTEAFHLNVELCQAYLNWTNGKEGGYSEWLAACRNVAKFQWREPLLEKQAWDHRLEDGSNFFVRLLLGLAERELEKDTPDFLWVTEIAEFLKLAEEWRPFPGWEVTKSRFWRLLSICYDNIQGSLNHLVSEEMDENVKKQLIHRSISYKKKALKAFRRIQEIEPDDDEVNLKITNLTHELEQSSSGH